MMDDDDETGKKETGGSNIFLDLIEKTKKGVVQEKKILEYNNKDPESLLEQFMMPKERVQRKGDNPESEDVELNFNDVDSDILKKIERNDFMAYCKENVKDRSYWGKKMTVDQILSYSKNINGPILALHGEVAGLAMKNFKRVVAIINEKVTKTAAVNIIKRMIKMAVKNSAEIRDEIFFQIIKQLRANYRQESLYQAWILFCIISCFITPSESSVYPILNYIKKDVIDVSRDDEVKKAARFVFVRIVKGFLTRGRAVLPCSAEIELIRKKQKLSARINLFTGGYLTVFFENYTIISDILKQICEMIEIPKEHWPAFGLYEVTSKPGGVNEETYIEEFIKLADVLASWEHEKLFYQRKLGVNVEAKFTLYFKIRFQYPLDKTNMSDALLLYNEVILRN